MHYKHALTRWGLGLLLLSSIALVQAAPSKSLLDRSPSFHALTVTRSEFGKMPEGLQPYKHTLSNAHGMPISVIHESHQQFRYAERRLGGYDFNWMLNNPGDLNPLAAVTLEAQSYPDLPNHPDFPSGELKPGAEVYANGQL